MKKIVMLVGFAAAIYGAKKMLSGSKPEQASEPFGGNGYAPAPQG
jgi:hypothetical protein